MIPASNPSRSKVLTNSNSVVSCNHPKYSLEKKSCVNKNRASFSFLLDKGKRMFWLAFEIYFPFFLLDCGYSGMLLSISNN